MDSLDKNIIKGIPVIQNKQDFIIGVFSIDEILRFTKYTERLIINFDENEEPIYNKQIQRKVENPRVEKIADFLTLDPQASFPTNIVLHIPKEVIKCQEKKNELLYISLDEKVFQEIKRKDGHIYISIIDGQHRIRGVEIAIQRLEEEIKALQQTLHRKYDEELQKKLEFKLERINDLKKIELVVSFFIDKVIEYQAMIFSTINRTQKRVSADLVSSLFGLDTSDTPHKTALQIVLSLNGHPKSPFYKRIKLYGDTFDEKQSPPLSQATMVKSIVLNISENLRESEKDRYKKRKELLTRNIEFVKPLPFRRYYALNQDNIISDILFYYFKAVKEVFLDKNGKSLWDFEGRPTNILHTTVGYEALLKILIDILSEKITLEADLTQDYYAKRLKPCSSIDFEDQKTYPFSTKGKNILYLKMSIFIWTPQDNNDERLRKLIDFIKES